MAYIGPAAAAAAIQAAGTDWDVVVMTAIAGAESGWDTAAISPTHDYGLMQVNINAWPELFQNYQWSDPGQNAQMGHHVWTIQGYRAWTTYTSGAYRKYLGQAQDAVGQAASAPEGLTSADTPAPPEDWAGWDYSWRVELARDNWWQALVNMSSYGSVIQNMLYQ